MELQLLSIGLALLFLPVASFSQDASAIIRKADELMRGTSSYAQITMTILKPEWQLTMTMKAWSLEPNFSLVLMTGPARDKGTVTLKRGNEVWNVAPFESFPRFRHLIMFSSRCTRTDRLILSEEWIMFPRVYLPEPGIARRGIINDKLGSFLC